MPRKKKKAVDGKVVESPQRLVAMESLPEPPPPQAWHQAPGAAHRASSDKSEEDTKMKELRYLQEMFSKTLDPVVVHMLMEDCDYQVDVALETLFKLAEDSQPDNNLSFKNVYPFQETTVDQQEAWGPVAADTSAAVSSGTSYLLHMHGNDGLAFPPLQTTPARGIPSPKSPAVVNGYQCSSDNSSVLPKQPIGTRTRVPNAGNILADNSMFGFDDSNDATEGAIVGARPKSDDSVLQEGKLGQNAARETKRTKDTKYYRLPLPCKDIEDDNFNYSDGVLNSNNTIPQSLTLGQCKIMHKQNPRNLTSTSAEFNPTPSLNKKWSSEMSSKHLDVSSLLGMDTSSADGQLKEEVLAPNPMQQLRDLYPGHQELTQEDSCDVLINSGGSVDAVLPDNIESVDKTRMTKITSSSVELIRDISDVSISHHISLSDQIGMDLLSSSEVNLVIDNDEDFGAQIEHELMTMADLPLQTATESLIVKIEDEDLCLENINSDDDNLALSMEDEVAETILEQKADAPAAIPPKFEWQRSLTENDEWDNLMKEIVASADKIYTEPMSQSVQEFILENTPSASVEKWFSPGSNSSDSNKPFFPEYKLFPSLNFSDSILMDRSQSSIDDNDDDINVLCTDEIVDNSDTTCNDKNGEPSSNCSSEATIDRITENTSPLPQRKSHHLPVIKAELSIGAKEFVPRPLTSAEDTSTTIVAETKIQPIDRPRKAVPKGHDVSSMMSATISPFQHPGSRPIGVPTQSSPPSFSVPDVTPGFKLIRPVHIGMLPPGMPPFQRGIRPGPSHMLPAAMQMAPPGARPGGPMPMQPTQFAPRPPGNQLGIPGPSMRPMNFGPHNRMLGPGPQLRMPAQGHQPRMLGPGPHRIPVPGPHPRMLESGPQTRMPSPGPSLRMPGPGPQPRMQGLGPHSRMQGPGPQSRMQAPGLPPRMQSPRSQPRMQSPGPQLLMPGPGPQSRMPGPGPQSRMPVPGPQSRMSGSIIRPQHRMVGLGNQASLYQGPEMQQIYAGLGSPLHRPLTTMSMSHPVATVVSPLQQNVSVGMTTSEFGRPHQQSEVVSSSVSQSHHRPAMVGAPCWPLFPCNLVRRLSDVPELGEQVTPLPSDKKVMCLMRGCPGSGKSTLARQLNREKGVIYSTDDYFTSTKDGGYKFDPRLLGDAHKWNQDRALQACKNGISPIIIDNTNTQSWEMKPYVAMAVSNSYQVEFREPMTSWKNKPNQLAKKNSHGVPMENLEKMVERYEHNVSVESILYPKNSKTKKRTKKNATVEKDDNKSSKNQEICNKDAQDKEANDNQDGSEAVKDKSNDRDGNRTDIQTNDDYGAKEQYREEDKEVNILETSCEVRGVLQTNKSIEQVLCPDGETSVDVSPTSLQDMCSVMLLKYDVTASTCKTLHGTENEDNSISDLMEYTNLLNQPHNIHQDNFNSLQKARQYAIKITKAKSEKYVDAYCSQCTDKIETKYTNENDINLYTRRADNIPCSIRNTSSDILTTPDNDVLTICSTTQSTYEHQMCSISAGMPYQTDNVQNIGSNSTETQNTNVHTICSTSINVQNTASIVIQDNCITSTSIQSAADNDVMDAVLSFTDAEELDFGPIFLEVDQEFCDSIETPPVKSVTMDTSSTDVFQNQFDNAVSDTDQSEDLKELEISSYTSLTQLTKNIKNDNKARVSPDDDIESKTLAVVSEGARAKTNRHSLHAPRLAAVFSEAFETRQENEYKINNMNWTFPDFTESQPNAIKVEHNVPANIIVFADCSSQTEHDEFAVLQKLESGKLTETEVSEIGFKVIAVTTDLSLSYISDQKAKLSISPVSLNSDIDSNIPIIRKLDQSTMTEDLPREQSPSLDLLDLQSCFPDIPVDDLQGVLDDCWGDVEWATNILMDSEYMGVTPSTHITEEEKVDALVEAIDKPVNALEKNILENSVSVSRVTQNTTNHSQLNIEMNSNTEKTKSHIDSCSSKNSNISIELNKCGYNSHTTINQESCKRNQSETDMELKQCKYENKFKNITTLGANFRSIKQTYKNDNPRLLSKPTSNNQSDSVAKKPLHVCNTVDLRLPNVDDIVSNRQTDNAVSFYDNGQNVFQSSVSDKDQFDNDKYNTVVKEHCKQQTGCQMEKQIPTDTANAPIDGMPILQHSSEKLSEEMQDNKQTGSPCLRRGGQSRIKDNAVTVPMELLVLPLNIKPALGMDEINCSTSTMIEQGSKSNAARDKRNVVESENGLSSEQKSVPELVITSNSCTDDRNSSTAPSELLKNAPDSISKADPSGTADIHFTTSDGDRPEQVSSVESSPKRCGSSETFTDDDVTGVSPCDVWGLSGGVVLQLDVAFALQLQEMFGPVGFHLSPDGLSDKDLEVKLSHGIARQLHTTWASTLQERFDLEQAQMEGMIQADEQLARKLQQEEEMVVLQDQENDKKFHQLGSKTMGKDGTRLRHTHKLLLGDTARVRNSTGASALSWQQLLDEKQTQLQEIMDEEAARLLLAKDGAEDDDSKVHTLAAKIKRKQLYQKFPTTDKSLLDDIFAKCNYDLTPAIREVQKLLSAHPPPQNVYTDKELMRIENKQLEQAAKESLAQMKQMTKTESIAETLNNPSYHDYRAEATAHYRQRHECFQKAAAAYQRGLKDLASFYSRQGHKHTELLKAAHSRASESILETRHAELDENVLDLHGLHVDEAIKILAQVLRERSQPPNNTSSDIPPLTHRPMHLFIITGRGKNSRGGVAKIKPAVVNYLKSNHYRFTIPNAGLIKVLW